MDEKGLEWVFLLVSAARMPVSDPNPFSFKVSHLIFSS